MGVVKESHGKLEIIVKELHLPSNHNLFPVHRKLLRLKSLEKMENADDSAYSLSVVFSADEQTKQQIKTEFIKFLKKAHKLVEGAPEKEVFQLNFDLHNWA